MLELARLEREVYERVRRRQAALQEGAAWTGLEPALDGAERQEAA